MSRSVASCSKNFSGKLHIDGHESKPAVTNFSIFFLFEKLKIEIWFYTFKIN